MSLLFQPTALPCTTTLHHHRLKLTPHRRIHLCPTFSSFKSSTTRTHHNPEPLTTTNSLHSLRPFIQSEWRPILSGWLCGAASAYSLSQIVPRVGHLSAAVPINSLAVRKLWDQGLVLGGLVLIRLVACYLQHAFLWEAALSSVYKVRLFVFKKVLARDLGFFEGEDGVSAGDVAYRITAEASDVADMLYSLLNTIVPSTLQFTAMVTQMVGISPVLSLISALVIPMVALVIGYLGEKLHEISYRAHITVASLSAYLNEILPSVLFVKANNAEISEGFRFKRLASQDLFACLRKKKMKALIPQIVQMLYFGVLFTYCAGLLVFSSDYFNCSAMVSFITSLVMLIEPIQDVGKAYNEFKQGQPAVERLFCLTRYKSQVIEKSDAVDLGAITGDVKFCGISFRYKENLPFVLDGLDLHIRSGETVALVGPSGGGKTTLVKLLVRLYDPSSGSLLIDGHDIQTVQLKSLRRHIGLVSQDITLFSGTVAQNIGYRDLMTGIDMERVELAAKTANAEEFIEALPDRYMNSIGPGGSVLSGGQKQRLSIARALYHDPSILVLDEATSALDSRSELLVRQALQYVMQNHTVLLIAHRLETVQMADRVFILKDGKLQQLARSSLLDDRLLSMSPMEIVI